MDNIIISMATYPPRIQYLKKTINNILNQTLKFNKFIINIYDNLTDQEYEKYNEFLKLDSRIEIKRREARWRSINKIIWTAKDNPDSIIITCDDDIFYPNFFFQKLYNKWIENKDCIIAHEISPVFLNNGNIQHIASVDIKLLQKTYGRYLTGCCLFPPHIFDDTDIFNWDKFYDITNATHDEIWLWCITTLKHIKSIGLNYTWSFDMDQLVLPRDEHSLSTINTDLYLTKYNEKINKYFKDDLLKILLNEPIKFYMNTNNFEAILNGLERINRIYKDFPIDFIYDKEYFPKSAIVNFINMYKKFTWNNKVRIGNNDN